MVLVKFKKPGSTEKIQAVRGDLENILKGICPTKYLNLAEKDGRVIISLDTPRNLPEKVTGFFKGVAYSVVIIRTGLQPEAESE